ncbi:hypothetical protein C8F04DRAFT_1199232 [Mycena alexandri]|uniref:Uncharacterized protein n=1 Tax=Mycena alexandri TaxID=1745969 RepID=A0AAD6WMQ1_9AGAR|nr:hypothetical protein C8F04DRAFT_1199232 [Mycena alexandri]
MLTNCGIQGFLVLDELRRPGDLKILRLEIGPRFEIKPVEMLKLAAGSIETWNIEGRTQDEIGIETEYFVTELKFDDLRPRQRLLKGLRVDVDEEVVWPQRRARFQGRGRDRTLMIAGVRAHVPARGQSAGKLEATVRETIALRVAVQSGASRFWLAEGARSTGKKVRRGKRQERVELDEDGIRATETWINAEYCLVWTSTGVNMENLNTEFEIVLLLPRGSDRVAALLCNLTVSESLLTILAVWNLAKRL